MQCGCCTSLPGGTDSIHAVKVPGDCSTGRGGVGDCVEVTDWNSDHHQDLLTLVADMDGEPRDLVETSLQLLLDLDCCSEHAPAHRVP